MRWENTWSLSVFY